MPSPILARALAVSAVLTLLAGCAHKPAETPASPDAEILKKIAQHAERASYSMQRLAALRGANGGLQVADMVAPAGLEMPISINWSGPVDSLVRKIAEVTGYEYEGVIGSKPVTPVLVTVAVTNTPAFNVLADAGAQAGSAADIIVRPETRKILVKYPPVLRNGGFGQPK